MISLFHCTESRCELVISWTGNLPDWSSPDDPAWVLVAVGRLNPSPLNSPIKIHCQKSLSTTSAYLSSSLQSMLSSSSSKPLEMFRMWHFIFLPSHILICVLIYLPYLPVNLRHIFQRIPHIQLAPMRSNLHCYSPSPCCTILPQNILRSFTYFYKIFFYSCEQMHCNEDPDRCISQASDNSHL